jgi:hypothetical protein
MIYCQTSGVLGRCIDSCNAHLYVLAPTRETLLRTRSSARVSGRQAALEHCSCRSRRKCNARNAPLIDIRWPVTSAYLSHQDQQL